MTKSYQCLKITLCAAAAFLAAGVPSLLACNGCRNPGEAMGEEPGTVMAGIAFSWSIMFMLVVVMLVVAGLTVYIARTCRRVDLEHQARLR